MYLNTYYIYIYNYIIHSISLYIVTYYYIHITTKSLTFLVVVYSKIWYYMYIYYLHYTTSVLCILLFITSYTLYYYINHIIIFYYI